MEPQPQPGDALSENDALASLLEFPPYTRLRQAFFGEVSIEGATPALPEENPWEETAALLREQRAAEAAAQRRASAEIQGRQTEAEKQSEQGRQRIREFLARMRAAGNPGCGQHDLTDTGRRARINYRKLQGSQLFYDDDDPDELFIQGWVIENNDRISTAKDFYGSRIEDHVVLSVAGDAFHMGHTGGGRGRLDPAKVTMMMLTRTLVDNGVEI